MVALNIQKAVGIAMSIGKMKCLVGIALHARKQMILIYL